MDRGKARSRQGDSKTWWADAGLMKISFCTCLKLFFHAYYKTGAKVVELIYFDDQMAMEAHDR